MPKAKLKWLINKRLEVLVATEQAHQAGEYRIAKTINVKIRCSAFLTLAKPLNKLLTGSIHVVFRYCAFQDVSPLSSVIERNNTIDIIQLQ